MDVTRGPSEADGSDVSAGPCCFVDNRNLVLTEINGIRRTEKKRSEGHELGKVIKEAVWASQGKGRRGVGVRGVISPLLPTGSDGAKNIHVEWFLWKGLGLAGC